MPEPLTRCECDFAEYHCMLARTDAVRDVGPLNEALLSAREVEDLALRVQARGGEIWFEPAAVVTFLPPETVRWSEIGFLSRRWSERANRRSLDRFLAAYDLDPTHTSALGFLDGLRRPLFGPVRRTIEQLGAPRLARVVDYGLHHLDRPVNRLLVRRGPDHY